MILKHCILNNNINNDEYCNVCKNNNKYELLDRNNKKYLITTRDCKNIILNLYINNNLKDIVNKKGLNYSISLIGIEEKEEIKDFIREWNCDKDNNSRGRGILE